MSKEVIHDHKIQEALELLNLAAREKGDDFSKMMTDKYEHLKDVVIKNLHAQEKFIRSESKELVRSAKKAALRLDDSVQAHPWKFIGGAALGGLVLGALISRARR
jgi:ElaB/YqjD/DUF883 family membrane-anchored ribosome-binding protein